MQHRATWAWSVPVDGERSGEPCTGFFAWKSVDVMSGKFRASPAPHKTSAEGNPPPKASAGSVVLRGFFSPGRGTLCAFSEEVAPKNWFQNGPSLIV